ncbi:MAG: twin-arginine translocase subunit TatC [Acidimicrobiales bacterium]
MTDTLPSATRTNDGQMSLMEHLIELRNRLIKCAIAIAIGAAIGWILYQPVLNLLREPLVELSKNPNVNKRLISLDPLEVFFLRIKMSTYMGIVITMPFLLWQLWRFVSPGLYQNERRYATAFVFSATGLFLLGAAIAYYTLPQALKFLQSVGGSGIEYQYSPQKYVLLIIYMMVAFGLGFQFPILVVFLQLVGVVTPQQLASWRRFAIVIIFVVAAVITPSADPISLFALALPMCLFYEISIIIGRLIKRRRLANEEAA